MTDVAGGLITLEEALESLSYGAKLPPATGEQLSARDADVVRYIKAATPVIEWLVGSPLLPKAETQRRDGGKRAVLLSGRLTADAVTAVRVDGERWTGFDVDEHSGILYAGGGRAFADGFRNVEVDVTAGTAPVPEPLKLAARELVRHWYQNGRQSPAPEQLQFGADASSLATDEYAIPRRVRQLCAPYAGVGFA